MRAAFCTGPRAIEIRDVPNPEPPPDGVLVRVHACGICGSDLHYYTGEAVPPAVALGHEICGRVAAAGAGLAAGDPVVVEPLVACGTCPRCRTGEPNLCATVRILGSMTAGGLADLVAVPATSVYRVPPALDLDTAMLAEPLAVGVHAVGLAHLALDTSVLVLGAGAIGLLTAFAAVRAGARVTVSARHRHQAAMAIALGATTAIESGRDAVLDVARSSAPDVVIEAVGGAAETLELALQVVRPGGRIVALGKFTQPIRLHPLRFLMKEVHLVSSMTYSRRARDSPRPDFVTALDLLERERERLAPMITHRVSLDDAARGFALAADKASGALKVAVVAD
jgi:2-desacetyl-2-hydroxyethyl bacteriochlorophyllide A dehydrogenase